MYIGRGILCVCVSVCLSLTAFLHYCMDPDVSSGNGRGCPLVVHYWTDFQSVQGFRYYDNMAPNAKCHRVLYSPYAWLVGRQEGRRACKKLASVIPVVVSVTLGARQNPGKFFHTVLGQNVKNC